MTVDWIFVDWLQMKLVQVISRLVAMKYTPRMLFSTALIRGSDLTVTILSSALRKITVSSTTV